MPIATTQVQDYGLRAYKVYPVSEPELKELRRLAWASLFVLPIPFLILAVIQTVNRIVRETKFEPETN